MCLPSVMSYNLGTVFILQTCSSTHTVLLVRRSGMNHPCHPPSRLLTSSCEACVCVCVCVEMQQSKIYLLICPKCPPSTRSNEVVFLTIAPFYPKVKVQLGLQLFYPVSVSQLRPLHCCGHLLVRYFMLTYFTQCCSQEGCVNFSNLLEFVIVLHIKIACKM